MCHVRPSCALFAVTLVGSFAVPTWGPLGPVGAEASPYSAAVLADNPLAYWRLGESAPTTATNLGSGGAGYDLTYRTGPSNFPATGQPGLLPGGDIDTSILLAGTDGINQQYLSVPLTTAPTLNFNGSQSFSLEIWASTTVASNSAVQAFMSTGGGSSTRVDGTSVAGGGNGYTFHINYANSISPGSNQGEIRLALHGQTNYSSGVLFPNDGQPHHVVVTFEDGQHTSPDRWRLARR